MMIDFLKPTVLRCFDPFEQYERRFIEWLLADAGDITPKQALIMMIVGIVILTVAIYYGCRQHKKMSKRQRKRFKEKVVSEVGIFWMAREIIMFVKKLWRKKR
ncbi:MAG: hypothetical protein WCW33_05260 [Candidatus Babeliales bacterium]